MIISKSDNKFVLKISSKGIKEIYDSYDKAIEEGWKICLKQD